MTDNKLILLNKEQIASHLTMPYSLHLYPTLDSTNRYLKDLPLSQTIAICCAEMQTQGRGRFGRDWHSPYGENIYCSSRWQLNYDLNKLSGLSLVTSLAILSTIKELDPSSDLKIKWPNDIMWHDKKLCGSLIELVEASPGTYQVIIGIGLNVNSDTKNHPLPDKPWCSLFEITEHTFDRNILIAKLLNQLASYLAQFKHHDFKFFMDEWNQFDYLAGKKIIISHVTQTLHGKACGINAFGQLILLDESGNLHYLSSGDASLHEF